MSSPTNSAAETSTARATPPYHFHVDDRHLTPAPRSKHVQRSTRALGCSLRGTGMTPTGRSAMRTPSTSASPALSGSIPCPRRTLVPVREHVGGRR